MKSTAILTALIAVSAWSEIVSNRQDCVLLPIDKHDVCRTEIDANGSYSFYNPGPPITKSSKLDSAKLSSIAISIESRDPHGLNSAIEFMLLSGWILEKSTQEQVSFAKPIGNAIGGMIIGDFVAALIGGRTANQMQGPYCNRITFTIHRSGEKNRTFIHSFFVGNYGSDKEIQIATHNVEENSNTLKLAIGSKAIGNIVYSYFSDKQNKIIQSERYQDLLR